MRDLDQNTITEAVLAAMSGTADARTRTVLSSLIRHLHDFVRDVGLTEDEWLTGIEFITRTGATCTDTRQEVILLSDVLGLTMLVDAVNNRRRPESTQNSVLGPFFSENRPALPNGADISDDLTGEPLLFQGNVVDSDGRPVVAAEVDVWHSDADGHYDVDVPGLDQPSMRASFRSDDSGRFCFRTVAPASYPIPDDGPVGALMRATNRSITRPAHIHLRITAQGYQRVTTMLFRKGDPYLDDDPVFGTKQSLVVGFERREADGSSPDGIDAVHELVRHQFVLEPQ